MSLLLLLAFPFLLLFFLTKHKKKPTRIPPGPKGLPIVGNLHQLNDSTLFLQLWQLSKKYGPLFSVKLGSRPAIVVSSPKLAKEIMKNHDLEFCGRPSLLSQQKLSYEGHEIIFSPYNEYWREIKKIVVVRVLSSVRVSKFAYIRQFEVHQMINKIKQHALQI